MQIIWDHIAVEKLRSNHTVLELETFEVNGKSVTAYCVVPAEKLFADMAQLESLVEMHVAFVAAFNQKNYELCNDIAPQLIGRFGGELDSFYEIILNKIQKTVT